MTRVLVVGAGVIGQIYAGRLMQAGHDVTILARGTTADVLAEHGISLRTDGRSCRVRPRVSRDVGGEAAWEMILVAVRRDQVAGVLPLVAKLPARRVVFMLNQSLGLDRVCEQAGAERAVLAFPGVGGHRAQDGTIDYLAVPQQHTTVGGHGGVEGAVADALRSAGFAVDVVDDMPGWLKTHAVFITAVGAAILACGGDSIALAADRRRVGVMVAAVREGFRALAGNGVTVTPTALRMIFTVVPRVFAVRYWRGQLRGPVGTVMIAPHMRATRDTELPLLCADVRTLTAGDQPTPQLNGLLDLACPPAVADMREAALPATPPAAIPSR